MVDKSQKAVALLGNNDISVTLADAAKAYSQLSKVVTAEGILKRDYTYYSLQIAITLFGFSLSLLLIILSKNLAAIAILSVIFGFFAVQIAGLVHDAGHRAIFKRAKNNDLLGYFFTAILAINYSAWKKRHNKHHSNPNEEKEDPDLEIPLITFTKERFLEKNKLERYLTKFQSRTYLFLLSLTAFYERRLSALFLTREFKAKLLIESIVFGIGILTWYVMPFLVFPLEKAILFFAASNAVSGLYLGHVFAPNHKGMPEVKKGAKFSFFEHQIITTRNIKPGWLTDYLYMGLNYQMEHHLFPHCPRNKLGRITPHLKRTCRRLGLTYTETNIIESDKIIIRELGKIASSA